MIGRSHCVGAERGGSCFVLFCAVVLFFDVFVLLLSCFAVGLIVLCCLALFLFKREREGEDYLATSKESDRRKQGVRSQENSACHPGKHTHNVSIT
jgi:Mg2+/citrate symporter